MVDSINRRQLIGFLGAVFTAGCTGITNGNQATSTPVPPPAISSPDDVTGLPWEQDTVTVALSVDEDHKDSFDVGIDRDIDTLHQRVEQAVQFWNDYLEELPNIDLTVRKLPRTESEYDADIGLEISFFGRYAQCAPEYESPGTRVDDLVYWVCGETVRETPHQRVTATIGITSGSIELWTVTVAHMIGRKLGIDLNEGPADIPINQGLIDVPVMDPRWLFGLPHQVEFPVGTFENLREHFIMKYHSWGPNLHEAVKNSQEAGAFTEAVKKVGEDIRFQASERPDEMERDEVQKALNMDLPVLAEAIKESVVNGAEYKFLFETGQKAIDAVKNDLDPNGEIGDELLRRATIIEEEVNPDSQNIFAPWSLLVQVHFATVMWDRYMNN